MTNLLKNYYFKETYGIEQWLFILDYLYIILIKSNYSDFMDNVEKSLNFIRNKIINQDREINHLREELDKREKYIESLPQLSQTYIGRSTSDGKITYRNWWSTPNEFYGFCDSIWFTHFLKHYFPDVDYKINMFSIFGNHYNIKDPMDGKKVFFSGENLNYRFTHFNKNFGRYALDYVDLALGSDLIDHPKYLRFPLWILYCFFPTLSDEDIENRINNWHESNYEKTGDICAIASHDDWGTRKLIINDIEDLVDITYAGSWRNNSSDLWVKYGDNKLEFLKNYKFNICPENLLDTGYVTEKIFDCLRCNTIPLYAGGKNYLEPKVLNHNAILCWYDDKDNSDTVELFKNLIDDKKSYDEFKDQNLLLDGASKYVIKKFRELEKHFERLIYD